MNPQVRFELDQPAEMPLPQVYAKVLSNDHAALEAALGREHYAGIIYRAGYKSARYWCEKDARLQALDGRAVFDRFLKHLSESVWGRFSLVEVDSASRNAEIRLDHSPFVLTQGETCAAKHCHLFSGWFAGAVDWLGERSGCAAAGKASSTCKQTQCGAQGHDHCIFSVRGKPPTT